VLFYYPGAYKNFDDLEEHLTRDELVKLYEKAHEIRKEDKRFAAALKGIDIDEGQADEFDEVMRRGAAKAAGMTEEEYDFNDMQIGFIDEDEEEDELV